VAVIMVIMIKMTITTLKTMSGYSNRLRTQGTRKLTSPSAVKFVKGYQLEYASPLIRVLWFCAGTGLAVVSSATGPTEYLKY
jgi:hypothetical protein